ncbi:MAG: DnaJ C-terminal domain-containing protein [Legionella sp.]|uniref:DnaJ C-terminal domain-containing protein n=1 Tax=Legionella sp. TaxID=459 RepID=UPI0039E29A18
MDKDYYKIMGLSEDATEKDIKLAYRRLARKYHPDLNKEPNAEERFKEMGEAYEVLKDPIKRAQYDNYRKYGATSQQQQHQYSRHSNHQGPFQNQKTQFNEDFFESIFGHSRYQQQPMAGQDYQGKITISLEDTFRETVRSIQIPVEKGEEITMQTLKVKIPAGITSGQQIRLAGQGAPGYHGGPRGDVYITINVEKHPLYDVMGHDIYLTLPVTPWEVALGATITVPTLGGKIDLKIPPGSQGGQKLRLKHRGLPGKTPGDQYILLKIITPPATTEDAKKLYQKMAEIIPFNPRKTMGA